MRSFLLAVLLLAAGAAAQSPAPELRPGDRIALVGNGLAYGLQHDGWFETLLAARRPDLAPSVRNLGFPADEVAIQQRTAGFGSCDEWLARVRADVVLLVFGFNESFAGGAGLPAFRAGLGQLCERFGGQSFGPAPARIVLVTPTAFESQGPLGPDAAATNVRLQLYAQAVRDVARERGLPCLELFETTRPTFVGGMTRDGVHPHGPGARAVAELLATGLGAPRPAAEDEARLEALRALVLAKDRLWFDVYQVTDGNNVYGGRAPLEYDGVTNAVVLQRELEVLEARADNADQAIHAAARGEPAAPARSEPPLLPVATNRPGPLPDGAWPFTGGEQAIAQMTPGDGLRIGLFASEERFPELAKPVQMSFDTRGRLWVACWPSYPHDGPAEPRADRLLILEDTDGDGAADAAHSFADDLRNPTGFEFWNGGVFVAQAPDLLFLRDTDGDDVADVREVVLSGLSSADTHHTANSFVLGPDGALYFQEGIFHQSQIETAWGPVRNHDACVWRYEPRTGRLERHAPYAFLNPHGHVFDRWGQDLLTDGTTNENYLAAPLAARVDFPARHPGYRTIFPQRSRPAAGTELLSSTLFPPEVQGDFLIANVIGFQGIFRYRLRQDGAGLAASEQQPLLFSADPNFRPVDLEVGPDGAVYVLDWQTPLIGHMQHHLRDPNRDHVHGRVYRVAPEGSTPRATPPVAGRSVPELLELLRDPEDRVRYRARIELSARDSAQVAAAVLAWEATLPPRGEDSEHARLEALWVLQQHAILDHGLLVRVLLSSEPRARAAAVRVLRQMRGRVPDAMARLRDAIMDPDPRVRLEALVALSWFPDPEAPLLALGALKRPLDPYLDYALAAAMRALEPFWRQPLATGGTFAPRDPAGLAWALAHLTDAELAGARPCEAVFEERLRRPGFLPATYGQCADALADEHGTSRARELLVAIGAADGRTDPHADHLLAGLFAALPADASSISGLRELATGGRRPATRRLAVASRLRAEGRFDPAWKEAVASPAALADLLEIVPLLASSAAPAPPALLEEAFERIHTAVEIQPSTRETSGAAGRYVRVELPGAARTLTLAEVQVFSGGRNIAPAGTASQSTTAWSGDAARAVDGNTSGAFGDDGATHTQEDRPDPWWELDLGREQPLDEIVLWNRDEEGGRFAARLDGWVLRVLDAQRRTSFEARGERAPEHSVSVSVASPTLRLRRAAVRALGALAAAGVQPEAAVATLLGVLRDPDLGADASSALAALPAERLSDADVDALGQTVEESFVALTTAGDATENGRRLLSLIDALLPLVEQRLPAQGAALRRERRNHGPQILFVRPVADSLQFDRRELTVVAGRPVELVFENTDIMPHNLVVAAAGTLVRVGVAAEALASRPDAAELHWVPEMPEVLHATRLLQPGQSQTLAFVAPAEPVDLPFLCTFPGHWVRMNGVLHVVREAPETDEPVAAAPAAPASPARIFVQDWSPEDFDGQAGGDAARGRAVLDAASCSKCHAIDGVGGLTGPELREVAARRDRAALLTHVLRPSAELAEGYAATLFFLRDGGVISGRVLGEDAEGADVLDDPYSGRTRRVAFADVAERRASEVSVMPEGLLSTFSRAEVLDLLAFLDSLRPAEAPAR